MFTHYLPIPKWKTFLNIFGPCHLPLKQNQIYTNYNLFLIIPSSVIGEDYFTVLKLFSLDVSGLIAGATNTHPKQFEHLN